MSEDAIDATFALIDKVDADLAALKQAIADFIAATKAEAAAREFAQSIYDEHIESGGWVNRKYIAQEILDGDVHSLTYTFSDEHREVDGEWTLCRTEASDAIAEAICEAVAGVTA